MNNAVQKHRRNQRMVFIKVRMVVLIVCILTVACCMMSFAVRVRHELTDSMVRTNRVSLDMAVSYVEQLIEDVTVLSNQVYRDNYVQRFLYEETTGKFEPQNSAVKKIQQVISSSNTIESAYLVSFRRQFMYSSIYGMTDFDYALDLSFVDWLKYPGPQIDVADTHRILMMRSTGELSDVISVYTKLPLSTTSRCDGMLVININQQKIYEKVFSQLRSGSNGIVYGLNERDEILFSQKVDELYQPIGSLPMFDNLQLSGDTGSMEVSLMGSKYLCVYTVSEKLGWKFVYFYPYDDIKSVLNAQTLYMIGVGTLLTGLCLIAAMIVLRRLVQPVDGILALVNDWIRTNSDPMKLSNIQDELAQQIKVSNEIQNRLSSAMPVLRARFFFKIIMGILREDIQKLEEMMRQYDVLLPSENLVLAMMTLPPEKTQKRSGTGLVEIAFEQLYAEAVQVEKLQCETLMVGADELIFIMNGQNCKIDEMITKLNAISLYIRKKYGVVGSISIYDKYVRIDELHIAYKNIAAMIDYREQSQEDEIMLYSEFDSRAGREDYIYPYKEAALLENAVGLCEREHSDKLLSEMIESFCSNSRITRTNIRIFAMQTYISLIHCVNDSNIDEALIEAWFIKVKRIQTVQSMDDAREFICELVGNIIHEMEKLRKDRMHMQYEKIERYMDENYMHDTLSMEMMSTDIGLSQLSINRVLKAKTGCTFIQRLTAKRMSQACHMLVDTDIPVARIAEAVGYSNANYFVRYFKQHNGMTPGTYREQNQKK